MADENKPKEPQQGPAPGQRAQTTGEPGRTTVAQKEPEKVPENKNAPVKNDTGKNDPTGSTNPVTAAKSQEDLDKAAVASHNAPSEPADTSKPVQKNLDEINKKLDELAEQVAKELESLANGGAIDDIRSQFVARVRRGVKSVGAAPIRHTSGGAPLEQLDEARRKGLAPVQGSF